LRASSHEKGTAASANKNVAENETHTVSHILACTSLSAAVSKNSPAPVWKNIPSRGATRKSKTSEESISSIQLNGPYLFINGLIHFNIFQITLKLFGKLIILL